MSADTGVTFKTRLPDEPCVHVHCATCVEMPRFFNESRPPGTEIS